MVSRSMSLTRMHEIPYRFLHKAVYHKYYLKICKLAKNAKDQGMMNAWCSFGENIVKTIMSKAN